MKNHTAVTSSQGEQRSCLGWGMRTEALRSLS
jgi:hypothetical protein